MHMEGERRIAATRDNVWRALNDPDILQRCIPGCRSIERDGDDAFQAVADVKLGPVKASFRGKIALEDTDPPIRCRLVAKGDAGATGFASGEAGIRLEAQDGETRIQYTADATVGGKLARVGARVVDAAARKIADEFFARLEAALEPPAAAATEPATAEIHPGTRRRNVWLAAFLVLLAVALYLLVAL